MNSTIQKWKIDDSKADRNGAHHTCYFVSKKGKSMKNTGEYSGSWLNNKKHGFGVQTTKSNKYEGGWVEGKKHGEGTQWVKRSGELKKQYFGGFVNGKRDGRGTFFYENGDKYEGMWQDGKCSGEGVMYYTNGDVYHGDWEENSPHGVGVLTLANGDSFEGGWQLGKKHGPGRFIYLSKGRMYEGEWVDGIAKCGVLAELPQDAMQEAAAAGGSDPEVRVSQLPQLHLAEPSAVISSAIAGARSGTMSDLSGAQTDELGVSRSAAGGGEAAPQAEAWWRDMGLTDEDVMELEDAFMAAEPSGDTFSVPLSRFHAVLDALGLQPTEGEVAALLGEMQLPQGATEVPFDAFVACMAAHREEA